MDELQRKLVALIDNRAEVQKIISVFGKDTVRNDKKMQLVFDHLKTYNVLPFAKTVDVKSGKSSEKSIEYRNTGNTLYAKKDLVGALSSYSKSIAAAPYPIHDEDNSNELAVAFANRSAVLFAMAKYEACLSDIDNALGFDYPDYLIYKLLERKGKCFQQLGKFSGASKFIKKSIDFLPLATSLSKSVIDQTLKRLESLYIETTSKRKKTPEPVSEPEPTTTLIKKLTKGVTDNYIGPVNLKLSEEAGRYIVADRDIMPGEVIVAEDPYASVLLPEFFSTHCFNCHKRFHALIPCKTCSLAMFCTTKCQEEAWEKYHRIECPVLPKLFGLNVKFLDWMLTLRLLLVASHEKNGMSLFLNKVNELNENLSKNEKLKDQFHSDENYGTIHSLVHNTEKRTYMGLYKLAVVVASIVNCLEVYTDLFAFDMDKGSCSTADEASKDPRIVIGGLLLQYMQIVQCNSYLTADLLFQPNQENEFSTVPTGSAIYKFASFINHSCYPNLLRSNHSGSSIMLIASRPIKKGEEVCCDYGFQFSVHDQAFRKASLLADYFFDCTCQACENNWPLANTLDANNPTFLCPKCKAPLDEDTNPANLMEYGNLICSLCKTKVRSVTMWELYKPICEDYFRIKSQLLAGHVHDFTPDLQSMIVTLVSLVKLPSKLLVDIQDAFLHCAMQMGNFYRGV